MQNYLKEHLRLFGSLFLNGDIFDIRCLAHVLNIITQEGLKVVNNALNKIRLSVNIRGYRKEKQFNFSLC